MDFRHVLAVLVDIVFVIDKLVPNELLGVSGHVSQLRYPIYNIRYQVKAIQIIANDHVKRCRRGAFFFIASYMQILMISASVGQTMYQPGIAVIGKDDRFVGGEQRVKVMVRQAMRMFLFWLQCHQVDYIYNAYF